MNVEKTKALMMNGGKISPALTMTTYTRMVTGIGETFQE
jgi:hypothetical protein